MNLLFITVDEWRYPPEYTTPEIKQWMKDNLKAYEFLRKNGVSFNQHRAGSTACAPSRATIHTGQYPSLHGVSQTDGAAKNANDADMFWLDQNNIPTWASFLQDHQTFYKGKWHVSNADFYIPGTINSVLSYNKDNGVPEVGPTEKYRKSNRLEPYDFNGWIGPEPHGSNPHNSGGSSAVGLSGRDIVYANEVIDLIQMLENNDCKKPWATVASFVNPHDITLYGELSRQIPLFNFETDPTLPPIPPAPNSNNTANKPSCQASYRTIYQQAFQPTFDDETYRKLYFTLQKRVDEQIQRILTALFKSKFAKNTFVIFTSDHGDYLGSHNLFQKWYSAYDEAIRVPFIVYGPGICPGERNLLTSHVDIVPTILSLLDVNVKKISKKLEKKYFEMKDFVGTDLKPTIYGEAMPNLPQYFMTDDNVLKGLNQQGIAGPYPEVEQPASVSTVIAQIGNKIFKYSVYFDNPQFAGSPAQVRPTQQQIQTAVSTPRQFELYNLTDDPFEMNNIANSPMQGILDPILRQQEKSKRLYPTNGTVLQPYFPNFPPAS